MASSVLSNLAITIWQTWQIMDRQISKLHRKLIRQTLAGFKRSFGKNAVRVPHPPPRHPHPHTHILRCGTKMVGWGEVFIVLPVLMAMCVNQNVTHTLHVDTDTSRHERDVTMGLSKNSLVTRPLSFRFCTCFTWKYKMNINSHAAQYTFWLSTRSSYTK